MNFSLFFSNLLVSCFKSTLYFFYFFCYGVFSFYELLFRIEITVFFFSIHDIHFFVLHIFVLYYLCNNCLIFPDICSYLTCNLIFFKLIFYLYYLRNTVSFSSIYSLYVIHNIYCQQFFSCGFYFQIVTMQFHE